MRGGGGARGPAATVAVGSQDLGSSNVVCARPREARVGCCAPGGRGTLREVDGPTVASPESRSAGIPPEGGRPRLRFGRHILAPCRKLDRMLIFEDPSRCAI